MKKTLSIAALGVLVACAQQEEECRPTVIETKDGQLIQAEPCVIAPARAAPVVPPVDGDDPVTPVDPVDPVDPKEPSGKNPNSGRGNGDEDGDPGKSEGKNQGGDEV